MARRLDLVRPGLSATEKRSEIHINAKGLKEMPVALLSAPKRCGWIEPDRGNL